MDKHSVMNIRLEIAMDYILGVIDKDEYRARLDRLTEVQLESETSGSGALSDAKTSGHLTDLNEW